MLSRNARAAAVIAGAFLLAPVAAGAATIDVAPGVVAPAPDGACALVEALQNANADTGASTDCAAGSGADVVALAEGATYTLTSASITAYGPTGLPAITSPVTLRGNGATIARDGGAPAFRLLSVTETGALTVERTSLRGGQAVDGDGTGAGAGLGGAIFTRGPLVLERSAVTANSAIALGGAIFGDGAAVTVRASTIAGNAVPPGTGRGGGLRALGGVVTLEHVTFAGNTEGGVLVTADLEGDPAALTMRSTIVADSVGAAPDCATEGAVTAAGATNLVETGATCPAVTVTADPLLAGLGVVAPPFQALQSGSPALDVAAQTPCGTLDQRGVERPQGAGADIGAYERAAPGMPGPCLTAPAAPVPPPASPAVPVTTSAASTTAPAKPRRRSRIADLGAKRVTVPRGGLVTIPWLVEECADGSCRAEETLTEVGGARRSLARDRDTVVSDGRHVIRVRLSRTAARLLRAQRSLRAELRLVLVDVHGERTTLTRAFTLRPAD